MSEGSRRDWSSRSLNVSRNSNVATNAAIFPGRLMRRDALPVISYCFCVFYFGCGSRI